MSQPAAAQNSTRAQKDARIAELDSQINALDDQIRSIRTNEGAYKYCSPTWREQQSNTLDALRNDLRREKWLLEGR